MASLKEYIDATIKAGSTFAYSQASKKVFITVVFDQWDPQYTPPSDGMLRIEYHGAGEISLAQYNGSGEMVWSTDTVGTGCCINVTKGSPCCIYAPSGVSSIECFFIPAKGQA